MQEKAYPHPLVWESSENNKTILRKTGDYDREHMVFGNKVFQQGKHVIHIKMDVYKRLDKKW